MFQSIGGIAASLVGLTATAVSIYLQLTILHSLKVGFMSADLHAEDSALLTSTLLTSLIFGFWIGCAAYHGSWRAGLNTKHIFGLRAVVLGLIIFATVCAFLKYVFAGFGEVRSSVWDALAWMLSILFAVTVSLRFSKFGRWNARASSIRRMLPFKSSEFHLADAAVFGDEGAQLTISRQLLEVATSEARTAAVTLLEEASLSGSTHAAIELGVAYTDGRLGFIDRVAALRCIGAAADSGSMKAIQIRDGLAKRMQPHEIAQAEAWIYARSKQNAGVPRCVSNRLWGLFQSTLHRRVYEARLKSVSTPRDETQARSFTSAKSTLVFPFQCVENLNEAAAIFLSHYDAADQSGKIELSRAIHRVLTHVLGRIGIDRKNSPEHWDISTLETWRQVRKAADEFAQRFDALRENKSRRVDAYASAVLHIWTAGRAEVLRSNPEAARMYPAIVARFGGSRFATAA